MRPFMCLFILILVISILLIIFITLRFAIEMRNILVMIRLVKKRESFFHVSLFWKILCWMLAQNLFIDLHLALEI